MAYSVPNPYTAPAPCEEKGFDAWLPTASPKLSKAMNKPGQEDTPCVIEGGTSSNTDTMDAGQGTQPINEAGRDAAP